MSDQQPDPGATQTPPGPESEPGAEDTEVFANAEFATAPVQEPTGELTAEPAAPGVQAAQGLEQSREQMQQQGLGQQQGQGQEEAGPQPLIPPQPQPTVPAWAGTAYQHTSTVGQGAAAAPGAVPGYGAIPGQPAAPGYPGSPWPGMPAQTVQPAPKRRRAGRIAGFGIAYAILAGGTAFGVIAANSPAPVDVTAVNASAYAGALAAASTSASAQPSASSSAGASASASASPTTAPPTTATPTSTVTGKVSDGVHSGDLRFFLLPPPQGSSSVQGDPDGDKESRDDIVQEFGGGSDITSLLGQLGFKSACDRTYQDSTMGANVDIELIQFSSSGNAAQFMSGFELNGSDFKHISVPGESGAQGWSYQKDGSYQLVGVYREGDTFYQVNIIATQSIPASALGSVVTAEHTRLAKG